MGDSVGTSVVGNTRAAGAMSVDVHVEPEQPADFASIHDVVRRAFEHHQSMADLVELIRASPEYIPELAFVARLGGEVVGYVMISRATVRDEHGAGHPVLTLSPLAVAPAFQRRGVGSALVREALARADVTGEALVTLEGSPRYYPRFGFRQAIEYGISIDLPDWAAREAAMVFPLSKYDPSARGRLEYPVAFAAIEDD